MSASRYGPDERDVVESGPRTDVSDEDELRAEFLRAIEDCDADDYETLEGRLQALLSDVRRHRHTGGDA